MISILLIILFFSLIIWWDLLAYEVFAAASFAFSLLLISDFWVESTILAVAGSFSGLIVMTLAFYLYIRPALIKPRAHQIAQLKSLQETGREKVLAVERHIIAYSPSEALMALIKKNQKR